MATKAKTNGRATTTESVSFYVPQIDIQRMNVTIIGDSALMTHAWSDKAMKMIEAKQAKKATKGKEARDPHQDYLDAHYWTPEGKPAMPSIAFKSAAVSACRDLDMKMTEARGRFHIQGELIEIVGEPHMRTDMVRVGMGVADVRYRPEFIEWSATLPITYNATTISPEQIINLLNVAGFGVGVGEWRPEKSGQHGRFHVATQEDLST